MTDEKSLPAGGLRPVNPRVNLLRAPLGVTPDDLSFSWELVGEGARQTAYRARVARSRAGLAAGGPEVFDTGKVAEPESSGRRFKGLFLPNNALFFWSVRVWDEAGREGPWSAPQAFTTVAEWADARTVWSPENGDFVFLRAPFEIREPDAVEMAVVSVTASSPEPARQYVYTLSLNGSFIGMGPPRSGDGAAKYNTFDVTCLLRPGENVFGAVCYTPEEKKFLLQMTLFYKNGGAEVLLNSGRDAERFRALDGSAVFRESGSVGTGYYTLAAENMDAGCYPFGFDRPGFDGAGWKPAVRHGSFETDALSPTQVEPMRKYPVSPARRTDRGGGRTLYDFGRELVGGVRLAADCPEKAELTLRAGEQQEDGGVRHRLLCGNVYEEKWALRPGKQALQNSGMKAFRYLELSGCPHAEIRAEAVAFRQAFDESAASFASSDLFLNRLYDTMKYTIKATGQDLYVDSQTRERGIYEGDALINMLSSYAVSGEYTLPRATAEYLDEKRQWPAEYKLFSPVIDWLDSLYTGDDALLRRHWSLLQTRKLYEECQNEELGLLRRPSAGENAMDAVLVDWPAAERDGYRMAEACYNTVFNAAAFGAYAAMAKIAAAIGHENDAAAYGGWAKRLGAAMRARLYDPEKGAFYDGLTAEGEPIRHYAQQASAFPLFFGVPEGREMEKKLAAHLSAGGLRCSVYGAFFVLHGLYRAGAAEEAVRLMTGGGLRSYRHILEGLGATLATEAWDSSLKGNMTFSHPWGSAPLSALAMGMFGVRPLRPGFSEFEIRYQPGGVSRARIRVPTVKGAVTAAFVCGEGGRVLKTEQAVPPNTEAAVFIPAAPGDFLAENGRAVGCARRGKYLMLRLGAGRHEIEVRQ